MPRRLSLTLHLTTEALEFHDRQSRDPVERSHWHMLWLVSQGHSCPTVATLVG